MFKDGNAMYSTVQVPLEIKAEDIQEDGLFKGWASTFGGPADAHGDVIQFGAFKDTLMAGGRNKNGIAMLKQHDSRKPIGVWTSMEELKKGLRVEGQIAMDVQDGRETHALMKIGALKGLSIGYDFPKLADGSRDPDSFEIKERSGRRIRILKRLDLWEISPVTFPANIKANIVTVKDFESCKTERQLENALREAGLSKQAAQHVVNLCKPSLRESGTLLEEGEIHVDLEQDQTAIHLLTKLKERNERFRDF